MGMKPDDAFALAVAAAQAYTDETVVGGGAIKGKNCTIKSITSIEGGQRVTFEWTLDNGTKQTTTMNVMNGANGATGAKGDKGDTGNTGSKGDKGDTGTAATIRVGSVISGESPSVVNGGTSSDAIFNFVLPKGDKGDRGATGERGADGQDGKSFEIKARFATYEELITAYPHGPENTGDAYFVGTTSNPDLYVWVTEDAEWVNNGPIAGVKGDKGDKGDTGNDGFSPVANVTKVGDTVTITVRDKTGQTTETVSDGADGQDGADGEDGVGISSIDFKEKDADGNNVYTVTLSNGDTYDFTAPKGDNGAGGAYFGTSSTSSSTATKVVTTTNADFELFTGADIIVKFQYDDTAGACLLKIDGTAAKAVKQNGSDIEAGVLTADNVYEFVYTGTYFEMVSGGSSAAIADINQADFDLTNKQLSLQPARRVWNGHKEDWEGLTQAQRQAYAGGLANFDDDNPYTQPDIYSTSEVKTNKVWIDGKPIYRKVFNRTNTNSFVIASDLETIVNIYGNFVYATGSQVPMFYPTYNGALGNVISGYVNSTNEFVPQFGTNAVSGISSYYLIVEYTKS